MKVNFQIKLLSILVIFSLSIVSVVSLIDSKRISQNIKDNKKIQLELIENHVVESLVNIDKAYSLFDADIERKMEYHSLILLDKYRDNPNFDTWNFEKISQDIGYDVYIVSRDYVITHTNYEKDLGLDFKEVAPKFAKEVLSVKFEEERFYSSGMDIEDRTGNIRKYSYIPTPDKKYLIELGILLEDGDIFNNFNFFDTTNKLVETYDRIEDITVFAMNGRALGKQTQDGSHIEVNENHREIFEQSFETKVKHTIKGTLGGKEVFYNYVPYDFNKESDEIHTDERVVEIIYNNDDLNYLLEENKQTFFIQLFVVLIISILVSIIISKLVARPMYLAFHDTLTGLSNRAAFEQKIEERLFLVKKNQHTALLLLDLDNFKNVNDTLGHDKGDYLLKVIAQRIKHALQNENVLISRLGGDEFSVLILDDTSKERIKYISQTIIDSINKPITVNNNEEEIDIIKKLDITVSIGVSILPINAEDTEELYKQADMALYFAKEDGKNKYKFYNDSLKS